MTLPEVDQGRISRAQFLKLAGKWSLGAVSALSVTRYLTACTESGEGGSTKYRLRMLGPSREIGHKMRDHFGIAALIGKADKAGVSKNYSIVIVGAGMAGLSAGWALLKSGVTDFCILELEDHAGGNSASGKNDVSAYPWGAHYVPLANRESALVRELFKDLGIIVSAETEEKPLYNELFICHDPQERLFKDGQFQEGLMPKRGLQKEDAEQIKAFQDLVHALKEKKGSDGKPVFAIPIDFSSTDSAFRDWDKISFADWLRDKGFDSRPLLWYLNYCCRDDYGALSENVSAWAGLHYFAGRRGRAQNAEENAVVTWPEGNGFLVNKLKEILKDKILTEHGVMAIKTGGAQAKEKVKLYCFDKAGSAGAALFTCEDVIFCAPRFLAPYLIEGYRLDQTDKPTYAPWLVANITVTKLLKARGLGTAWDNVCYNSDSLGYVVATHQNLTTRATSSVLTYYYPLSGLDPVVARRELTTRSTSYWKNLIIKDLSRMHPEIESTIVSMDLWPWGHGMVSPGVDYIWQKRKKLTAKEGRVYFAHSDMSGISNFEEAQYQGVTAAQALLKDRKG